MAEAAGANSGRGETNRERSQHGDARPWWFTIAERLHELPIWIQYALSAALVLVTVVLRQTFLTDQEAYLFVFFMPAILLASTVLTHGAGIMVVIFSAVVIKAVFVPPPFSVWFSDPDDLLAILVFVGSGLVTAVMGSALHDALFRLSEANQRIAASEARKAVMLDELAHRFKNDLANLTAILRLQARDLADPQARSELMVASDRINVLSRVHQRLAPSPRDTQVDMAQFLTELCQDWRVAAIGPRPIALRAELERAELPFSAAVSLGLIVNELVQNAVKYAFPGDRPGSITVRLRCWGDSIRLSVADDGIGRAAGSAEGSGLGERLVASIAQSLGATYEVRVGNGRVAEIALSCSRQGRVAEGAAGPPALVAMRRPRLAPSVVSEGDDLLRRQASGSNLTLGARG